MITKIMGTSIILFAVCFFTVIPGVCAVDNDSDQSSMPDKVADSLNQFSFDVYKSLSANNGNLFISPFSVATALSMTLAGTDGKTADEMASILYFSDHSKALHKTLAEIFKSVQQVSSVEINIANALFPSKTFSLNQSYTDLMNAVYNTDIITLDYQNATEESRNFINDWVEQQTNDRIKNLLTPGNLSPLTVMVLTNAIYFKGDWAYQFDKKKTVDGSFRSVTGESHTVPMMNQKQSFRFYQSEELKMLEMPFDENRFSMIFVLPDESIKLSTLEKGFDNKAFARISRNMKPVEVSVQIPRFRIEWGATDLSSILQTLGMKKAFTPNANFSVMTDKEGIYVNMVVHKAFVEVNEEGAEAAAATAVEMRLTSMPETFSFIADRPFLFLIREMKTDLILFMGRVAEF